MSSRSPSSWGRRSPRPPARTHSPSWQRSGVMSGSDGLVVVKVGGSLFDLADLGARLRAWLEPVVAGPVLLVPGGGPTADVVRAFDRLHALGEETAHWLAVRALTLNAHFLQTL